MRQREVRADAVAHGPLAHVLADGDDLASRVGAWHEFVVRGSGVGAVDDDQVSVLNRGRPQYELSLDSLGRAVLTFSETA